MKWHEHTARVPRPIAPLQKRVPPAAPQLLVLGDAGVTADEGGVDRAGLCAWLATAPPFGGSRQVLEQRDRCVPPNAGVRNAAAIGQWYAGNELLPTSQ